MPSVSYGFDEAGVKRIVAAVRKAERLRSDPTIATKGLKPLYREWFFGVIVAEGPEIEGEPQQDYEDERYWIKRAIVVNTGDADEQLEFETITSTAHPQFLHVTAHNTAEMLDGSHLLVCGQIVQVYICRTDGDERIFRYEFQL